MFNIGIRMKKRTLVVMIMPIVGRWECAAVETASSAETVGDVFEEHGHKVLGSFTDMQKAVDACEGYARKWVKGQQKIEACECKEIAKRKPVIDAEFEPQKRSRRKAA